MGMTANTLLVNTIYTCPRSEHIDLSMPIRGPSSIRKLTHLPNRLSPNTEKPKSYEFLKTGEGDNPELVQYLVSRERCLTTNNPNLN